MSRATGETDPLAGESRLLGRTAEIVRIMAKHGLREVLSISGPADRVTVQERARRFRTALEELGPTFAKLGQILSTRPDLLPAAFVEELATLQDQVTPLTEAEVVSVMEEELGVPWEDVFEGIDPKPLAAGTIGQVHRATLDGGERVVVKVQRPTARRDITRDLGLLEAFAEKTADRPVFRKIVDIPAVIEHLSSSLRRELDFREEAANIERMREVLAAYPRLGVPRVHEGLSSARLLVMEEVQGVPVRQAPEGTARKEAARQLLEAYYQQVMNEGFFHADPHPGNLMWWNDRIYFLDFGMVGVVEPEVRELLLLLLMAFWQGDGPFLSDVVLMLSREEGRSDIDLESFQQELGDLLLRYQNASLAEIQLGPILQGLTEIAIRHEVQLPASLALTGKALAQMQLATAELDPELDPFSVAGSFVLKNVAEEIRGTVSPRRMFYEAQKARARLVRVIEAIERVTGARPGAKLQVDFRGTEPLEEAIRGAGRRVALGLCAGGALLATGITASSADVAGWLTSTLGSVGGALTLWLVRDLLRRH